MAAPNRPGSYLVADKAAVPDLQTKGEIDREPMQTETLPSE